jgi:DNA-binding NarL/FixJ family response regulator
LGLEANIDAAETEAAPVSSQSGQPAPRSERDGAVRVLLVGDGEIIAVGLGALAARHPDQVELIGHIPTPEDLVQVATRLRADVVLLELSLQIASGPDLVGENLSFRVVIFTDDANEQHLFEALRLGVSGYPYYPRTRSWR